MPCHPRTRQIARQHPHVVQDVEWIARTGARPALVVYSLGNLLFDAVEPDSRRGALVWTVADRSGVIRFRALSVRTHALGAAVLTAASDRDALWDRLVPRASVAARDERADGSTWFGPPAGAGAKGGDPASPGSRPGCARTPAPVAFVD